MRISRESTAEAPAAVQTDGATSNKINDKLNGLQGERTIDTSVGREILRTCTGGAREFKKDDAEK